MPACLLAGGFWARYKAIKDSPLVWATLVPVVLMLLGASYSDAPVADQSIQRFLQDFSAAALCRLVV